MSRIASDDNVLTAISKMSEGNPEAITVLMKMLKTPEAFAPADPVMEILGMDSLEIYGSDIWNLGEYVCRGQNMDILSQILSNYAYGKLSKEVLIDHIKNREPFEKLYAKEELHEDIMKRTLPMIEKERHDELVAEGKYHKKYKPEPFASFDTYRQNPLHENIYMPKDTYQDMPVETFVGMLKDRGFVCGCNKKLKVKYWTEEKDAEWNVYYQPETGFIVPLMTAPGTKICYFGGDMITQRYGRANVCKGGSYTTINNGEIGLYSKDIREEVFAWYDNVCTTVPCLEWKTDGQNLDMDMTFLDRNEEEYNSECCELLHINTWGVTSSIFRDICTLNNMELFDEGLKKITAQVKNDLGTIITNRINGCVNFGLGLVKTRQVLDYLLEKIGKDYDWLTKNGVNLEKAFLKGKDFSCEFQLEEPVSLREYCEKSKNLVVALREQLGCGLNGKNGKLFEHNHIPWYADENNRLITTISFEGKKIATELSDEELQRIVAEILDENGFHCKLQQPLFGDLQSRLQRAVKDAAEFDASKEEHQQVDEDPEIVDYRLDKFLESDY